MRALGGRRLSALAIVGLLSAPPAFAWGPNAHRLVTSKAVDTLPPELRDFFDASRDALAQRSADPHDAAMKNPAEARTHFLRLDHYGRFPFDGLPREYKAAVKKYGQRTVEANGVLPWQIGVLSERLTNAFKARRWDDVRATAALLAHFVADAHDPFDTTEDSDGHKIGQGGIDQRFSANLVDRYLLFLFIHPNDASHLPDPTDHAFEMCLGAHSWLEHIFLADRRARRGAVDYTDEYYDRFYNQAGSILIREISDAATDVGSYWLTSWINAGRPSLPPR